MSMNLALELNGVLLDKLYQTPTSITYWCIQQSRWAKQPGNNPAYRHPPMCSPQQCYNKYRDWCYKSLVALWITHKQDIWIEGDSVYPGQVYTAKQQIKGTYEDMALHLKQVRALLEAGATFCVL